MCAATLCTLTFLSVIARGHGLPSVVSKHLASSQRHAVHPCAGHKYIMNPIVRMLGVPVNAAHNKASSLIQPRVSKWDTVIDAGAFDAVDFTMPAFKNGYTVYTFEFDSANQKKVLNTFAENHLQPGKDYTVVDVVPGKVPTLPHRAGPHIFFFKAGVSNVNGGFASRPHEAAGAGVGAMEEVGQPDNSPAALPTLRLDDVVPETANIYMLKMDIQGHEPFALDGASRILQRRGSVRMLSLEWWPTAIQRHGVADGGVAALRSLYDYGATCYDLGSHPNYNDADRPSALDQWTAHLLDIPKDGPHGDPVGAWEDIVCTFESAVD